jgi:hypothetical protein
MLCVLLRKINENSGEDGENRLATMDPGIPAETAIA